MKKLIIKTAFITLGVTLILAIAAFGIVSLCAPAVMMDLTASLGMTDISGDYAYQEYERSREISYLARSFEIAAEREDDVKAQQRFGQLYKHEAFSEYCVSRDEQALPDGIPALSYRGYVCGLAACVEYRLARMDEARDETIAFAVSETEIRTDYDMRRPQNFVQDTVYKLFCLHLPQRLCKRLVDQPVHFRL